FSGFLHTDGYAAYGKLPVNNVYCWAHVRRKFFEALGKQPSPKSHAKIGLDFCDKMFRIERTFNKLSAEERFVARKETLQPVMTEFFHWCESFAYLPKSQLGKAVQYAVNHKDGLQIVLLDGRLEISRGRVVVKDRLAMKEQKTAKHNSVYISNKLRKTILEYVQQEFPDQLLQQDFDGYLFPSRKGTNEPLNRQSLWRIIHDAGTAIGLKDIGPHSMRKTFGYFLYKQGTKTEIIQS
ncbi:IS66 family transposase, partial [Enterococcus faecium]|uniref:IS66 family transposase n=1 Tax=Enterococcus faecium TaxID=1352 RepID=UPI0021CC5087